jgi:hypothetical protein
MRGQLRIMKGLDIEGCGSSVIWDTIPTSDCSVWVIIIKTTPNRASFWAEIWMRDLLNIHSFINDSTALLLGPGLFFSFVIFFTQTVGLLERVISPSQGLYLHKTTTQTQNKRIHTHTHTHTQTSMLRVGFEPTIPASKWAKKVHALERSATVIGDLLNIHKV